MSPREMGTKIRLNSSVKVVHGRRAALMAISGEDLAHASNRQFGSHISTPMAAFNRSKAETLEMTWNLTKYHRMQTSKWLAQQVRDFEARERKFLDDLGKSLVGSEQFIEYDYESLLLPGRHAHLAAIFQFILGSSKAGIP